MLSSFPASPGPRPRTWRFRWAPARSSVDVLEDTYNLDPDDLHRCIQQCLQANWGKPAAVVAVHEFWPGRRHGPHLEDRSRPRYARGRVMPPVPWARSTRGKPVGTLGRLGIFSFHPRKAVTTGEGGDHPRPGRRPGRSLLHVAQSRTDIRVGKPGVRGRGDELPVDGDPGRHRPGAAAAVSRDPGDAPDHRGPIPGRPWQDAPVSVFRLRTRNTRGRPSWCSSTTGSTATG